MRKTETHSDESAHKWHVDISVDLIDVDRSMWSMYSTDVHAMERIIYALTSELKLPASQINRQSDMHKHRYGTPIICFCKAKLFS